MDLAGNEGSIETLYHSKAQMAEAAEINASLMALKSCLHARAIGAPLNANPNPNPNPSPSLSPSPRPSPNPNVLQAGVEYTFKLTATYPGQNPGEST